MSEISILKKQIILEIRVALLRIPTITSEFDRSVYRVDLENTISNQIDALIAETITLSFVEGQNKIKGQISSKLNECLSLIKNI